MFIFYDMKDMFLQQNTKCITLLSTAHTCVLTIQEQSIVAILELVVFRSLVPVDFACLVAVAM